MGHGFMDRPYCVAFGEDRHEYSKTERGEEGVKKSRYFSSPTGSEVWVSGMHSWGLLEDMNPGRQSHL